MAKLTINDLIEKKGVSLVSKGNIRIAISKGDFEAGTAEDIDASVSTLGIFEIHSLDEDGAKFKCNLPLTVLLNVFSRSADSEYIYLDYAKNDVVIEKMGFVPSVKPTISFLGLVTGGKLENIEATELAKIFKQNLDLNEINSGVPTELIEAMISDLVRWKEDHTVRFRLVNDKVPKDDYVVVNIKDAARLASVFGAMSFEDVKKAAQAAVLMTRKKKKQNISPLEIVMEF